MTFATTIRVEDGLLRVWRAFMDDGMWHVDFYATVSDRYPVYLGAIEPTCTSNEVIERAKALHANRETS
jgi:hypothetical protein